ncbi:MAG: hypothetical protein ACK4IZ_04210 [Flavobacterium sp.]|uniref:hypothetical protein n=1 Tax=Flavobacterium sp. TaxID=239 RepID=UPI00391C9E9A
MSALALLISCSGDDDNYKSFQGPQEALLFNSSTSVLEVSATTPSFIEVLVSSTTVSNVDRTIDIQVSSFSTAASNQYSIDMSTAVIPAGSTTARVRINSGDFNSLPAIGGVDLVLVFDSTLYSLPNRSNHIVSIQRACSGTRVNFNINFDGYGSEIGWTLSDASGIVASANAGAYTDGQSTHSEQFCLAPGTYTFVMTDSYGDGMSFPNNGTFTLRLTDGTTLASGGGNFGFQTPDYTFTIN